MDTPPRVSLVQLPTPLHRLDRLSELWRVDLWIKRDDLTGLALGGNKGRKLEYLMADALSSGAQAIVTCGALQSNFIRQLGAACAVCNVGCVAAVMSLPFSADAGKPPEAILGDQGGNALLDSLFGVEVHRFPNGDWSLLYAHAEELALELEARGVSVYRIPVGGSSALGAFAFYEAAREIEAQADHFDFIVTSTSSGSTQAGLAYGLQGLSTRLIGIAADPEEDLADDVAKVGDMLARMLGRQSLAASSFDVRTQWAPPAYGVPSPKGNGAIERMARAEGILLDPIYTGKAFAGLIDLIADREIQGRVLFWHTGGIPTLFATSKERLRQA